MVVGKFCEVFGVENGLEFLLEDFGVSNTDAARDNGTDVTDDGFTDFVGELSHKLVS